MHTTLLTAILITIALALILFLSLWVSLRHRSRAIHAAAAAEAGPTPSVANSNDTSFFGPGKRSKFSRPNAATSTPSAERQYLAPAPGQSYLLPYKQQVSGTKLLPHPSIKRKRKAPPLVAAKTMYRLPSSGISVKESGKQGVKEENAISPTHTGAQWPLPLQLDAQSEPQMEQVVNADGNFEDIHLEKRMTRPVESGAWMEVARRVADRGGVDVDKPLPDVKDEGAGGRHGTFDFETGNRGSHGSEEPDKANGGRWRLSSWARL